jgi:CDP-diglyceride synthetase
MRLILVLYLLNSFLFLWPLTKQFKNIILSPEGDKKFNEKFGLFSFSISMLAAMWACYFALRGAAWFFFLMAIIVDVRAYYLDRRKK